jgi:dienelactone hydrolase
MRRFLLALFWISTHLFVHAQEILHIDINESIVRVPVTVSDIYNKPYNTDIALTIFKPNGDGPFPLVVINHGRGFDAAARAKLVRARYESAARFFVRKGFAVAVPTRLGNGDNPGAGDPESMPSCSNPRYPGIVDPAIKQVLSVIDHMQKLPYIDPEKLIVLGQSVGGLISIGLTASKPRGLIMAINFAGGHGGDPVGSPGNPCQAYQLNQLFATYGKANQDKSAVPTLWIYTENDKFFSPKNTKSWFDSFIQNGGKGEYLLQAPNGEDGHLFLLQANDIWQPVLDAYLHKLGFTKLGMIASLVGSQYANIENVNSLPYAGEVVHRNYGIFLQRSKPRAFAINPVQRRHGYASGDDAKSNALAACQRETGIECQLYAVDDEVVWRPTR